MTRITLYDYNLSKRFKLYTSYRKETNKKLVEKFRIMGRLVQNHSTHIEGLIKWLKKISENEYIKTITPASISKAKGRGEKLALRVTIKTNEGYKLLARKGKLVQEVFIVTKLDEKKIKELINKTNPFSSQKKREL